MHAVLRHEVTRVPVLPTDRIDLAAELHGRQMAPRVGHRRARFPRRATVEGKRPVISQILPSGIGAAEEVQHVPHSREATGAARLRQRRQRIAPRLREGVKGPDRAGRHLRAVAVRLVQVRTRKVDRRSVDHGASVRPGFGQIGQGRPHVADRVVRVGGRCGAERIPRHVTAEHVQPPVHRRALRLGAGEGRHRDLAPRHRREGRTVGMDRHGHAIDGRRLTIARLQLEDVRPGCGEGGRGAGGRGVGETHGAVATQLLPGDRQSVSVGIARAALERDRVRGPGDLEIGPGVDERRSVDRSDLDRESIVRREQAVAGGELEDVRAGRREGGRRREGRGVTERHVAWGDDGVPRRRERVAVGVARAARQRDHVVGPDDRLIGTSLHDGRAVRGDAVDHPEQCDSARSGELWVLGHVEVAVPWVLHEIEGARREAAHDLRRRRRDHVAGAVEVQRHDALPGAVLHHQELALQCAVERRAPVLDDAVGGAVAAEVPGEPLEVRVRHHPHRVAVMHVVGQHLVRIHGRRRVPTVQDVLAPQGVRVPVVLDATRMEGREVDLRQEVVLGRSVLDRGHRTVGGRGRLATRVPAVDRRVEEAVAVPHEVVRIPHAGGEQLDRCSGRVGVV